MFQLQLSLVYPDHFLATIIIGIRYTLILFYGDDSHCYNLILFFMAMIIINTLILFYGDDYH